MVEMVENRGPKHRVLPLAAWGVTGLLSLAIIANAFLNQPDTGRAVVAADGSARLEVEAPDKGGRTIQLKFDPVVEAVQRELSVAGYYKGPIDGVIGRKTRQAIAAYQAAVGLEADGQASADLAEHIRYTRQVSEISLFTGTIKPDPDAEVRARIRRVQTGLAELAYSPGAITGELNSDTRTAIIAFQRDRKLPETGEITDALLDELGKMSGQSELVAQ